MIKHLINDRILLDHAPEHMHLEFSAPHHVLSSAVLNGGAVEASHIVNLKVPKHSDTSESPEETIENYCRLHGWEGTAVGMMTAASMDSLRIGRKTVQGVEIAALVTSGLSNARRAGDRAEHRAMLTETEEVGTINIVVLTSAILTPAAMVEALMIATEAKSAALQALDVRSPVSGRVATGTGTDAMAVVSGTGPGEVRYCGKHVLFGEVLGRLVMEAVAASLQWELN